MWSLKYMLRFLASAAALVLAGFIAISRLHDGMHREVDILGGATIGVVCAVLFFNAWIKHEGMHLMQRPSGALYMNSYIFMKRTVDPVLLGFPAH